MDRRKSLKFPVCSLCSQSFALRGNQKPGCGPRSPLILKCGHTACEGCIVRGIAERRKVTCSCHEISSPSEKYLERNVRLEFPLDYYTIGVYSVLANIVATDVQIGFQPTNRQHNRTKQHLTVNCLECCKVEADCTCIQCDAPYCSSCFKKVHQLARAFREHKTIPLRPTVPELGSSDAHCPIHRLQLEFFCNDCSKSICSRCLLNDHKGHNIDLLADKNKVAMDDLIDLHVTVVNHQKRLKATRKKVAMFLSKGTISSQVIQLEKSIMEHFSWLHGCLINKQHQLLATIYSPYEASQKAVREILDLLEQYISETEAVLSVSDRLVRVHPKYDASVNYMDVISALTEKAKLPCFFVSESSSENFQFVVDQSIFTNIDSHCRLEGSEDGFTKFLLVRENELPENYEIEPIQEVTKENSILQGNHIGRSRPSSIASHSSQGSLDGQCSQLHEFIEGGMCAATLCHLTSPSDFYVHRVGVSRLLANLQAQFSRLGALKKHPPIDVIKGRVYLVKYGQDNNWYRGRVMNIGGIDEIEIFYIDYGNSEKVSKDRLRTLPVDLTTIEGLATHCRMHNCVPAVGSSWSPEAVSLMAQLSKNGDMSIVVKKIYENIIDVDILQHVNNSVMSLQESLLFLGLAVLAESCDIVLCTTKPTKSFPPQQQWREGETVQARVTYIESLSHFYVLDVQTSQRTYLKMKEDLIKFYSSQLENKKLQVCNPHPGMPVAVQSGPKEWFRAQVIEVPAAKTVKVFLIDSGNEKVVSWKKTMGLIPKFLRYPPLATKCRLGGIIPAEGDTWTAEAIKVFKVTTCGANLKLMVNAIENDTAVVTAYSNQLGEDKCINALLVEEGMAKRTDPNAEFDEVQPKEKFDILDENVELFPAVCESTQIVKTSLGFMADSFDSKQANYEEPNPHFDNDNDRVRIKVTVKRIVSPDEFYVSPTWMTENLVAMKKKLTEFYCETAEPVRKYNWKCDNICAVNVVVENQAWHRAVILEILENSSVKVRLLDEGSEEIVPLEKVFPLDTQFRKLIEGVVRCRLGGIQSPMHPAPWPYASVAEFEELADQHSNYLFITKMGNIKDRSLPVELFIQKIIPAGPLAAAKSEWDSVNNRLRLCGLAADDGSKSWIIDGYLSASHETLNSSGLQAADKIDDVNEVADLEQFKDLIDSLPTEWTPAKPFESLEFLANPTYVDNNGTVFIQDFQKSVMILKSISEELNGTYNGSKQKPYDKFWSVGQICIVRYHLDGNWYRGQVQQIKEDGISVKFVDYGNVEDCSIVDMRRIPLVADIPIQCHPCYFYNVIPATPDQQWTTNLLDFVHSSLVEKRCQVVLCIMSNEEGDQYGISSMRMPTGRDFIMQMVEEGHLKYTEVFMSLAEVSSTTDMLKDNDEDSEDNEAEVKDTSEEVIIESDEICMSTTEEGMKEESDAERTLYWVDLINQDSAGPITHYKHIVIHEDMDSLEVEMTAVLSVTQILVVITDSNHDSLNAMKVKFHEMMSVLQEEGPNQPKLEQPYLYQSCCVKFSDDQKWYRGIVVQELPECKLLIQYVDYGNVEIIPADQVHQLKEEWSSVEVQAMLINLNGIKVSCVDRIQVAKMMSECLLSNTLLARIKDRKGHGFNADLYIGEKLAYQDLIDNNCIEPISWYNESIGVH